MTATALGTQAGSRSAIQEAKPIQADSVRLEDAMDGARAGRTQAQGGMVPDILRQVGDRPVGLPRPAEFGGRLAGQHDDLGLAIRAVPAGRGLVGPIGQARQPRRGEALTPAADRVAGDADCDTDVHIGRSRRRAEDDPGALRLLLAARPGAHPALQFVAFGGGKRERGGTTGHSTAPCLGAATTPAASPPRAVWSTINGSIH